jgi:hypothetical protein
MKTRFFVVSAVLLSAALLLVAARQLSDTTYQQDHVSWTYVSFEDLGTGYRAGGANCVTFDFYGSAVVFYGASISGGDYVIPSLDDVPSSSFDQSGGGTVWDQQQFSVSGLSLDNHELKLCPRDRLFISIMPL